MSDSFKDLNARLLSNSVSVLSDWFPSGKLEGQEYKVGSLQGESGESLSINTQTGVWKDFASGDGGSDLVSLYAASRGLKQGQALMELGGAKPLKKAEQKKKTVYKYENDYQVIRIDFTDGTKKVFAKYQGQNKHHPKPRPLYKPHGITHKNILIVEGEKSAHAAHAVLGHAYSCISWPQGTSGVKSSDWDQIPEDAGSILIWPDCDDPGYKAASEIINILKRRGHSPFVLDVRRVNLFPDRPGWDVVDAMEHFNGDSSKIISWAKKVKINPDEVVPSNQMVTQDQDKTPKKREKLATDNFSHIQDVELSVNKAGNPVSNMSNACKLLENLPHFEDQFYFDTFYLKCMVRDHKTKIFREITDHDKLDVLRFMQEKLLMHQMTKSNVKDAMLQTCFKNKRSAPKMWLESLKWDGTHRVQNFFINYTFSQMPMEYLQAVSKNFFVGMVARIYEPGCKFDNMLVLESEKQGVFKSTLLETLVSPKWYASLSDKIGTKDFLQSIQGKWLIEFEEMADFAHLKPREQKKVLSTRTDRFRPPYGDLPQDFERQCVFVGTTNEDDYLDDRSGSRRFWPVKVSVIDIEAVKRDREQLWAEAVHLLKSGEDWWSVPQELHAEITGHRNDADVGDPWEELVERFVSSIEGTHKDGYINITNLLVNVIGKDPDKVTRGDSVRIGKILRRLGYMNKTVKDDGVVVRGWMKEHTRNEAAYALSR